MEQPHHSFRNRPGNENYVSLENKAIQYNHYEDLSNNYYEEEPVNSYEELSSNYEELSGN